VAKVKNVKTALQAAPMADIVTATRIKQQARMFEPSVVKKRPGVGARPAATGKPQSFAPGVERWPVKTGTDNDVKKVNLAAGVVQATVEELHAAARPDALDKNEKAYYKTRLGPVETTVWQVTCQVTAVKFEADGDYHLVLQGQSGETIIGEIPYPDPKFVAPGSPFLDDIRRARAVADSKIISTVPATQFAPMGKYMVPLASFSAPVGKNKQTKLSRLTKAARAPALPSGMTFKAAIKPIAVRVTGVGFFDRIHGQMGVAPNGIELHPVLDVQLV
jgi:hypothetical protein